MIYSPALWAALLITAPPPTDFIGCAEIARDPVAFYVAHGDVVTPGEAKVWQCVAVVEVEPPEKPRKRKSRRRR